MRARLMRIGLALVAALTLFVIPSLAQGRGRGHSKAKGNGRSVAVDRDSNRRDRDRGRVIFGDDRVLFPGTYNRAGRPPGWDRGRKVGWGNCDMPPGQAKKYGCRSTLFRQDRYPRNRSVILFPFF